MLSALPEPAPQPAVNGRVKNRQGAAGVACAPRGTDHRAPLPHNRSRGAIALRVPTLGRVALQTGPH
eukprot:5097606-Lingulodinium_polyedra.AAC.1